jgi:hypothetical protein
LLDAALDDIQASMSSRRSWVCVCSLLVASQVHAQAKDAGRYVTAAMAGRSPLQLRAAVKAAGFRELATLPGQRLLLERVASAADVDGMPPLAPFTSAERVSSELQQLTAADDVPVMIHAMPGASADAVLARLADLGLPVLGAGRAGASMRVSTKLPGARATELALELGTLDDVLFVERIHHLGLFNDRSAGTVQSGMQGAGATMTPIWQQGIRGEGQVVGIIDTGVDADSCYFSADDEALPKINTWSESAGYGQEVDPKHSKILAYDFLFSCDQYKDQRDCDDPASARGWDNAGHGTHCSGNMTGDRTGGPNNGMAPNAKLVVQDAGYRTNDCADLPGIGCPVIDTYPLFAQAYAQGVRIHNNSYGDNENAPTPKSSNYSARSQDVDRFVWDHKDMLIVHAAGNSGMGDAEFSVCSPSTNKNGLSVGSVRTSPTANSDDNISSFSSRGWTADGRIKPELMVPGCNTSAGSDSNITSHNCSTDSGCGTSYAAPTMVGTAALVRQYLTDGYYPSGAKNAADALQPTAALLKALLVNSAVSLGGKDNAGQAITPIPSNEQGWGRVQLDRALVFAGSARKLYLDDHKTGFAAGDTSTLTYTLTGVDPAEPLKITLAWTDYPGMPDGAPAAPKLDDPASWNMPQLVNDLDLRVTQGMTTYLGNAFMGGSSISGGNADRRNNVEQVLIAKPDAGAWTVEVVAEHIVQSGQDFALAITGKWSGAGPARDAMQPTAAGAGAAAAGSAGVAPSIPERGAGGMAGGAGTPASPSSAGSGGQTAATSAGRTAAGSGSSNMAGSAATPPPSTTNPVTPPSAPHASGCSITTTRASARWPFPATALACLALGVRRRRRR